MNWHYLIIIAAVLILFISMGSNPFEPPEGWVPPDEFKDGIKAKISQPAGGFGDSPMGIGGGNYGGGFNGNSGSGYGSPSLSPNYGIGSYEGVENYQPNAPKEYNFHNAPPRKDQRFEQNYPQPNSNVPAPFQNLPSTNAPQSANPSSYYFPGSISLRTEDGRPLKFSGSLVYTVNDKGRQVTLPDGEYYLSNGRSIRVSEGYNMFPNNGNEFN